MSKTPSRGRMAPETAALLMLVAHRGTLTSAEAIELLGGDPLRRMPQRISNMRHAGYLSGEQLAPGLWRLWRTSMRPPDVPMPAALIERLAKQGLSVAHISVADATPDARWMRANAKALDVVAAHPTGAVYQAEELTPAGRVRLDAETQAAEAADDDEAEPQTAHLVKPAKPDPRAVQAPVVEAVAAQPQRHQTPLCSGGVLGRNLPPVVRAGSLDALRLASRQFGRSHQVGHALGVVEAGSPA